MPADYNTTAKALALPISPISSLPNIRPPWTSRISNASRRASPFPSPFVLSPRLQSYGSQILGTAQMVQRKIAKTFFALPIYQRVLAIVAAIFLNVSIVLFLIYNERIFGFLAPYASKWRDIPGGWLILWALTFIAAFPPIIGYSTTITIAGFVYGFPSGWIIVASATVCGSLASFIASRTILSGYVHRLVAQERRFEAFALTLKHDGLKILCMIRVCPLPYSLSNAAMSTFPTVNPLSFALATAIASPKLLVHVFIGSRLASIAEGGEVGHHLDVSTKFINYTSIVLGSIFGIIVGWIIYHRTIARARELELAEIEAGTTDSTPNATSNRERSYNDPAEGAEALMNDDISLWDTTQIIEDQDPAYKDYDSEEDLFNHANINEDHGVKAKRRDGV